MNKPHGGIIRINCNTRCLLGAACLFSLSATAKIFQCVENGHTRFSEHPCGKAAQEVKVAIPANLGQSVSHEPDEQLQKVTEEIARDNRRRELTRLIARKQSDLKIMHDQFSATMAKLETGLARAKSEKSRYRTHEESSLPGRADLKMKFGN
ncbi:MAG: hypothetical protein CSA52_01145 [Gammaproteobacteria bacterium]|nr:MAG: hypothetical protein CSA52_01145 [Gammaproteobacteria bacterium]